MAQLNFAGKDSDYIPCRVFDAAGVEHQAVVRCDTETGHVEKYRPDPKHPGKFVVDRGRRTVLMDIVRAPAPLTIGEW